MDTRDNFVNSVNLNEDTDFPYLVLRVRDDESYPHNPGFRVMHWHEDLQFVYVISGTVVVRTLEEEARLSAGKGAFINKNVVHFVGRLGPCEYRSFLFPEYLVSFYPGGPAAVLTRAVTEDSGVALQVLDGCEQWCAQALGVLRELTRLEEHKGRYYCYEVLSKLAALWCLCIQNMPAVERVDEGSGSIRMMKFLQYIELHYAEELTLGQLAQVANVSKSECARCFKSVLGTTPYKYLMEYRLSRAARLLAETSLPVGEVARQTGWGGQSYFSKRFREKMGCTPREYRARGITPN